MEQRERATLIPELDEPISGPITSEDSNAAGTNHVYNRYSRSSSWREYSSPIEPHLSHFNIGIIIDSTSIKDAHVSAINKPASRCQLTSLVVLHPHNNTNNKNQPNQTTINDLVGEWLKSNKVAEDIEDMSFIGQGEDGCEKMLRSDTIHAVYIIVPPSSQKGYVLQALDAKKHVLVNDPVSTSLPEFMEELSAAKRNGKFIQTTGKANVFSALSVVINSGDSPMRLFE